jgi:2-dehydro-3-deoxyphosphogluconate aldolase/(4S)-4-hydroxy-2-oxoglutarate aldolase
MTRDGVKRELVRHGIVSIIRGSFAVDAMERLTAALLAGGVLVVEVTLNSAHALDGIATLRERFGDTMLVGAGTVRTADDVGLAVDAGATYLVAPNLDLEAVREAQRRDVLLVPGIFTATEAQTAFVAGCEVVKLFPADALGPRYLKALRAPLDHIDFVPSGGIDHTTIGEFHRAGAVAYGVGSALIRAGAVDDEACEALAERARVLTEALAAARGGR